MKNNPSKHHDLDPGCDLARGFKVLERLSVLDGQVCSVELLVPHDLAEALSAEELAKYERDRQEARKAAELELVRREKAIAQGAGRSQTKESPCQPGGRGICAKGHLGRPRCDPA